MRTFFTQLGETLLFHRDVKFGPLPPLLVAMTIVTGLVDSFSYLALGHVFVANMTGNVVLLAFSLVGAHGFSSTSSLVSLGSFGLGSVVAGRISAWLESNRGRHLGFAAGLQALLLATAADPCRAERATSLGGLPLQSDHRPRPRDGDPERHGAETGGSRADHDGAHPDDIWYGRRQRARQRARIQVRTPPSGRCRHARGRSSRGGAHRPPPQRLPPPLHGVDRRRSGNDRRQPGQIQPLLGRLAWVGGASLATAWAGWTESLRRPSGTACGSRRPRRRAVGWPGQRCSRPARCGRFLRVPAIGSRWAGRAAQEGSLTTSAS